MPEVRPLERDLERPAAELLAAAFIDDPGWSAVGPLNRARRLRMLERFFQGHMRVARRWGGPITFVKRALVHVLRQYLSQIVAEQTRFNLHAAVRLAELEEQAAAPRAGGQADSS